MFLNQRRQALIFPNFADNLERGYPIHTAWEHTLSKNLPSPGPRFTAALASATEALKSGESLAVALRGMCDDSTLSMISTGEEVGDLPSTLRSLAGESAAAGKDLAALADNSLLLRVIGPDAMLWMVVSILVILALVGLLYKGPEISFSQLSMGHPATRKELHDQTIHLPAPPSEASR